MVRSASVWGGLVRGDRMKAKDWRLALILDQKRLPFQGTGTDTTKPYPSQPLEGTGCVGRVGQRSESS
jgi:hypothetical protein